MYKVQVRPRETPAIKARQPRPIIEIAATNPSIPLEEDWADRWCTLPKDFEDHIEKINNFEVRPEDIFVVTFMKSGTTWTQEAIWLLLHNMDYEGAKKVHLMERSVFLDVSGLYKDMPKDSVEICNKMPSPRLIKSHLPANLLPKQLWEKKQKTIYVARNVKDVVVSCYHFIKGLGTWSGTLDEFAEDFMNNDIMYTPFWANIVDFWKMRNEPFICFITYEEMKRDLVGVLQKLCRFLGRPVLDETELKMAVEHLSFKNMKDNEQTNYTKAIKATMTTVAENFEFMRRGIVGSYKDELTPEYQRKLDDWSRDFLSKHGIQEEEIFGKL